MNNEDIINPLELLAENEYLINENERLHSIIKEVRECLIERKKEVETEEPSWVEMTKTDYIKEQDELLEILDKENNNG